MTSYGAQKLERAAAVARRRVLFVAEALTLAHAVRLVTLAESLDPSRWDVHLATDPRYGAIIGTLPFPVHLVQSMPSEQFVRAISRGTPIFSESTLAGYVEDDLRLIGQLEPDAVIGDFRISLGVSARVAAIPFVNVTNAYWSPYAKIRHVVPEIEPVRWFGATLGQPLFDVLRPLGHALHTLPVNRVRRRYGLSPLASDFRAALTDGDVVCYADIPEVVPVTSAIPENHRFIGPVPWSPRVPLPEWWDDVVVRAAERPAVYVSLGSSGPPETLQLVLDALESLPVIVIAATAGHARKLRSPGNAFLADYLPGDTVSKLARAVVCNGGSPACYQALAAGKPVVGLATNMDQFLNMAAVEDAGCGRLLRSASCTAESAREAVREAMEDSFLQARAIEIMKRIAQYPAARMFADSLASLIQR